MVNLVSAWLLHGGHEHDHDGSHDHNLRAAFLHVLADALTSVLAIAALLLGRTLGWTWTDPLMGLVGAVVISRWALGLVRETGAVLLDVEPSPEVREAILAVMESAPAARVVDLHVWGDGSGRVHVILAVDTSPEFAGSLRAQVEDVLPDDAHATIHFAPP